MKAGEDRHVSHPIPGLCHDQKKDHLTFYTPPPTVGTDLGFRKREGRLDVTKLQELESAGLRPTFSRMSVLALFSEQGVAHLAAEEVHQRLHDSGVRIGLATIYRVLTQFEHAGLLSRHKWADGRAVYELASTDHHDHMICTTCKKLIEFCDPAIEERKKKIAEEAGFTLQDHLLYLYVACRDDHCPNKKHRHG